MLYSFAINKKFGQTLQKLMSNNGARNAHNPTDMGDSWYFTVQGTVDQIKTIQDYVSCCEELVKLVKKNKPKKLFVRIIERIFNV